MIRRLFVVLLGLLIIAGGISAWKVYQAREKAALASKPPPPATVATARVRKETWQPFLHAVGSLVATQEVFVSNEVAGMVEAIHFDSGQSVEKGSVLLQLDNDVDRADLQGLIAEQHLAELMFHRTKRLLEDKSASRSDYDEAQAKLESIEASVASKKALLEKKEIRAPFSGVLGIRQVNLGQYLSPGSQIVSLQSLDPLFVDYSLPERHLAEISVNMEVEAEVQAYSGKIFKGRITAISPRIERATRNVHVRATITNLNNLLRPGMFSEVRILQAERKNILTVPDIAITYTPYGDSVFVVEKKEGGSTVQRRQVKTGKTREGKVEVTRGLQEGEEVVTAGQIKLRNGQRVRVDNSIQPSPGEFGR